MKTTWISPPGDTISDILEDRGETPNELADKMNVSYNFIFSLINGNEEVTPELARKLAEHVGSTTAFWLNREKQHRDRVQGILKSLELYM